MLVAPLLLATSAALLRPQEAPAGLAAHDLAFFEQEVRPLLVEHCLECHGEGKRRPKGGLRLDGRAGWERGGDSGPSQGLGDEGLRWIPVERGRAGTTQSRHSAAARALRDRSGCGFWAGGRGLRAWR